MCSDGETQLDWYTLPVTYTQTGSNSEQATLDYITIMAPMFQLNRKASDLASATITSSDVTSSDATTVETGSAATSQSSSDSASTSGGLSTGAQAGIGAGVGVVGLAIIGVALYLWRRKRNASSAPELSADEPKTPGELAGSTHHPSPQPYQYHPVELDASHAQRSEMQ
ncbi:hypothetical protein NM208_g15232 [Fusarium decemcellulare]|uniref:Uncharacterized protein n=1 Tax=Fusarium decemcellulare TaxID=57161 RepID=A0ACC1RG97_9HYPO|nr:hypothetical protein NM208_g15232 [Fusarium decemcellulare]